MAALSPMRALSSESSFGGAADTFDHVASLSSTPPTTVADTISLASEGSKHEHVVVSESIEEVMPERVSTPVTQTPLESAPMDLDSHDNAAEVIAAAEPLKYDIAPTPSPVGTPSSGRSKRARASLPVYNLSRLSGTAGHGKRSSKGDVIINRRRRQTVSEITLVDSVEVAAGGTEMVAQSAGQAVRSGTDALDVQWSMRGLKIPKSKMSKKVSISSESRRVSTRSSGAPADTSPQKQSSLGKRSRKAFEQGLSKMAREIRRLQDTNEFAGIDVKPVLYTTWAKGKEVTADNPEPLKKKAKLTESPKKKAAVAKSETPVEEAPVFKQRRVKKFLDRGLYSGQEAPMDIYKGLNPAEKKALVDLPELVPSGKYNKSLPLPMFNGLRLLIRGKDYKLPFDICHPLPPGQPKPDEWRKMTRNRFVGNAAAYWKKTPHFKDYQSKCVCTPADGCAESCQNRIMLYECDTTNCNAGAAYCQNRAFARLQERVKAGGKYRVGVEVIKTSDRGYGIRSNRCFQPGQIIMEYTGEIITEEECDRRMNEKYVDNVCYYLMSFDQNMIIDATTGSIARFVNHSCTPNSRMIKWIVSGQPRMALFAGDRPIMTGEELTYDYNFDPFSAKNVQKCLCGSANCRGVLGPKPKEVKPPKIPKEELKKAGKAGKRKLKEMLGNKSGQSKAVKKRKIKTPTGIKAKTVKTSVSKASLKAAKGGAKVVKKTISTISVKATKATGPKTSKPGSKIATVKHKSSVVRTYSKTKVTGKLSAMAKKAASHKTGPAITAATAGGKAKPAKPAKRAPLAKNAKSTLSAKTKKPAAPRGRPRKNPISTSPAKGAALPQIDTQSHVVPSPA